jgi:hypothetical protein
VKEESDKRVQFAGSLVYWLLVFERLANLIADHWKALSGIRLESLVHIVFFIGHLTA